MQNKIKLNKKADTREKRGNLAWVRRGNVYYETNGPIVAFALHCTSVKSYNDLIL